MPSVTRWCALWWGSVTTWDEDSPLELRCVKSSAMATEVESRPWLHRTGSRCGRWVTEARGVCPGRGEDALLPPTHSGNPELGPTAEPFPDRCQAPDDGVERRSRRCALDLRARWTPTGAPFGKCLAQIRSRLMHLMNPPDGVDHSRPRREMPWCPVLG